MNPTILKWNPEISYPIILSVIGGFWVLVTYLISRREANLKESLDRIKTIRQLNGELKVWADEVIDILSDVGHLCDLDPKRTENFFNKRHGLLVRLSALIDKGRFYLPNTNINEYGHHKPSAFRGITREPLSHMKKCYKILDEQISYTNQHINAPLKKDLMHIKRAFCSSIQNELNPQKYFIEFRAETEKKI